MIAPLLPTKLNIPPVRKNLVTRGRLINRLDEAVGARLALISAPAGFGKTTLMSEWAQKNGLPCAWLSLDVGDNNPSRFLTYAITSLKTISPDIGEAALTLLGSTQSPAVESIITILINELSSLSSDFFLLLDDYHVINSQVVNKALEYLIENMPQPMHIVLTSRSDPPLPLSRMRARGQLLELRQADLRFSTEEASGFLSDNFGLHLTAEQIASLEARTEGWIAGFQLAALSMRGRDDLEAFLEAFSGSHRFVIDYLADEVFARQTEDLRQFLCETSILERLNASLSNAVTGRSDSDVLLRTIEDTNLFLLPLDDQRQWYRYHNLFQDFLQTRLDVERKSSLHRKACQWFLAQGRVVEAVTHAITSGDTDLAEAVIIQTAADTLKRGDIVTLLSWLDALPDQRIRANLELSLYKSYALLLTNSNQAALPYAQAAEANLTKDASPSLQGQFMSLKAQLLMCEDQQDESIRYARDALEYLDEDNQFFRNLTLNGLGQVLELKGDVRSAAGIYQQAFETGWRGGDRLSALIVFTNLVFALNELGRRREAVAWCEQVMVEGAASGTPLIGTIYLPWSLLAFEANQLDTAREYAQHALEVIRAAKIPQGISWGQYILGRIYLAEGKVDQVRKISHQGQKLASQIGRDYTHGIWFAALQAEADLQGGDPASALRWMKITGISPQAFPHHWYDHPHFTFIRALLATGQLEDAQILLDTLEASARAGARDRKLITIHLLQALALLEQGQLPQAVNRVEHAITLAAANDYIRPFLDEGQKIAQLILKARSADPVFLKKLLRAYSAPSQVSRSKDVLFEPLTERELEVLELIAKGLSNQQIAEVLFVTVGTIKKHLNNIFIKLSVESRTQAVARGQELEILKR